MSPHTYVFQDLLDLCHAQNGHPDGDNRAQKVTELQRVVIHNAHYSNARLVTGVVEL